MKSLLLASGANGNLAVGKGGGDFIGPFPGACWVVIFAPAHASSMPRPWQPGRRWGGLYLLQACSFPKERKKRKPRGGTYGNSRDNLPFLPNPRSWAQIIQA